MGYQDFTDGATLPASQLDEASKQGVLKYATAAARDADATLTAALREGMVCYLDNTNTLTVYSGSAWSTVGPVHGALTAYTPAVVQLGAVTSTNVSSMYQRVGRLVTGRFWTTITGSGTASNIVTVSMPVTADSAQWVVGTWHLRDNSAGLNFGGFLEIATTTTFKLLTTDAYGRADGDAYWGDFAGGANASEVALAANDYITGTFSYIAAADA